MSSSMGGVPERIIRSLDTAIMEVSYLKSQLRRLWKD